MGQDRRSVAQTNFERFGASMKYQCVKCDQLLDWSYFYKSKQNVNGIWHYCKSCVSVQSRAYRNTPKGRRVSFECVARWRKTPRGREWYRISNRKCSVTERGKECKRKANKKYLATPKGKMHSRRHEAKRRQIEGSRNDFSLIDWQNVKTRFYNSCAYCLSTTKKLAMDHLVPLSRGGSHIKENIVPSCKSCNSRKSAKPFLEFIARENGIVYKHLLQIPATV